MFDLYSLLSSILRYQVVLFFSSREMEDISSVSRVAFGEQKKHVPSAIAESEGLFSQ